MNKSPVTINLVASIQRLLGAMETIGKGNYLRLWHKVNGTWKEVDITADDKAFLLKTRHQFAHCTINYLDDGGIEMLFSNSKKQKVLTFDELSSLGDKLRRVFTVTK